MKKIFAKLVSSINVSRSSNARQMQSSAVPASNSPEEHAEQWVAQARAATVGNGWTYLRYDADGQHSWTRRFQRNKPDTVWLVVMLPTMPSMQTWKGAKPGSADWRHITMLISRHESSHSDKDEYRLYIVTVVTIFTIVNIVTTVYYSKQYLL